MAALIQTEESPDKKSPRQIHHRRRSRSRRRQRGRIRRRSRGVVIFCHVCIFSHFHKTCTGEEKAFLEILRYFASSSLRFKDFLFKKSPKFIIISLDTLLFTQHSNNNNNNNNKNINTNNFSNWDSLHRFITCLK